MDARALLEANLELIERVIRFTARRQRLDESECEEFASIVKLKLIDNDYAVIRKFEGRSHLATFITIVVHLRGNEASPPAEGVDPRAAVHPSVTLGPGCQWRETSIISPRQRKRGSSRISTSGR